MTHRTSLAVQKKMERTAAQKEAETRALKAQLEESTGVTQQQINEKDRKINELMEDLGNKEVHRDCCVS